MLSICSSLLTPVSHADRAPYLCGRDVRRRSVRILLVILAKRRHASVARLALRTRASPTAGRCTHPVAAKHFHSPLNGPDGNASSTLTYTVFYSAHVERYALYTAYYAEQHPVWQSDASLSNVQKSKNLKFLNGSALRPSG